MQAIFAGSQEKEIPIVDEMRVFDYKQSLPKLLAVDDLEGCGRADPRRGPQEDR